MKSLKIEKVLPYRAVMLGCINGTLGRIIPGPLLTGENPASSIDYFRHDGTTVVRVSVKDIS